jgi:hypothetical protein
MDAYLAILDKQEQNRTIIPVSLPQLPCTISLLSIILQRCLGSILRLSDNHQLIGGFPLNIRKLLIQCGGSTRVPDPSVIIKK